MLFLYSISFGYNLEWSHMPDSFAKDPVQIWIINF